jgi:hypothetical protein
VRAPTETLNGQDAGDALQFAQGATPAPLLLALGLLGLLMVAAARFMPVRARAQEAMR